MNGFIFLLVGLTLGLIATYLVSGRRTNLFLNLVMGMFGAFVGGSLFEAYVVMDYSIWSSVAMALVGAVMCLFIIGLFSKKNYEF